MFPGSFRVPRVRVPASMGRLRGRNIADWPNPIQPQRLASGLSLYAVPDSKRNPLDYQGTRSASVQPFRPEGLDA